MLLFCSVWGDEADAQLQPGDIAVIGVQSDGTDLFAWVPLVDLSPGQEVFFTDAGWHAEAQAFQRQVNAADNPSTTSPSGGAIRYIVPPEGLPAGTVVEVRIDRRIRGEPGAYELTVTGASAADFSAANDTDVVGDQGLNIATTGDQLLVLTGSLLQPMFIFGVNTGADQWDRGSNTAQHASDLPAGLTAGSTAIAIGAGPGAGDEVDNGRYVGPETGSRESILAAVADPAEWETANTAFDDLTGGRSLFNLIPPEPVIITLDTLFTAPEDTARITIRAENTTDRPLGFLGFRLKLHGKAIFAQNGIIEIPGDVSVEIFTGDDETLTVTVTPQPGHLSILAADTVRTIGVLQVIPHGDALGKTIRVELPDNAAFTARDISDLALNTEKADGAVQTGIRGDFNVDSRVNILDAASVVYRLIHNKLPATSDIRYHMADVNADGSINIGDIIGIIRLILGLPLNTHAQPKIMRIAAELQAPYTAGDRGITIPFSITTGSRIAGLSASFAFDASRLQPGSPLLVNPLPGLIMESVVRQNMLHVLAVSPSLSLSSPETEMLDMTIPVRTLTDSDADFTLTALTVVDAQGREMPVDMTQKEQVIVKGTGTPGSFALQANVPNPFNPQTQISYVTPRTAHVTIRIYDLLGREVALLTDRVHAPGRYRVVWHARNKQGEPVGSGIYMYRLTTDTGYSETRKMLLLK